MTASDSSPFVPLDVVRAHPLCAETPVPQLRAALTPAASVYVRSNFDTPPAHPGWTLAVHGRTARTFTLDDLAALPQHEVTVTMECAGNWRLGMDPVPTGEPWQYGAVSTTTWRGVRLADVLAAVGVPEGTVEVLASGADAGPRDDADGPVRFQRALPLETAQHPDTLVATHMAGAPLTADHGAPLRLVVPRWYGMASVKWLEALELLTTPFTGYFQQQRYVYDTPSGRAPVATARVKSLIVSPAPGAACRPDSLVHGWAWSGNGAIARVEVAVNGVWHEASLGTPVSAHAWTPFALHRPLPKGTVALASRATDASGAMQPERIEWNRLGYGNNAVRTVTVQVEPAAHGVIRRATLADAAALSAFARAAFDDAFGADNAPADMATYLAQAFTPARQADELSDASRTVLLLEDAGALVAYASLARARAHDHVPARQPVELERFYVARAAHGRGVADVLMAQSIAQARAWGGDALWLGVWERNARAIRFYTRQGFETVGAQTFRLGSDLQQDLVMRRPL